MGEFENLFYYENVKTKIRGYIIHIYIYLMYILRHVNNINLKRSENWFFPRNFPKYSTQNASERLLFVLTYFSQSCLYNISLQNIGKPKGMDKEMWHWEKWFNYFCQILLLWKNKAFKRYFSRILPYFLA